nr:hypothetical protein [Tanacetum cinerariifolium]
MATTDKELSAAGMNNRPPMLEESDFDSWKIRIQRYIRGKPNGKLIWISIKNGPSPHPTTTDTTGEGEQQTKENVELLMQGSGLTKQQQKEIFFDQYERFRANGNESIHDYFVRFHKLINDIKITKIKILAHHRNTKFLNNLPSYWSKYVTIVKNSQDISNVSYVNLYTHLKSYEQHAMKNLSKMNQSSGNTDPLAYMAQTTKTTREYKEKKQEKDSQWFKDKAFLMGAKEKGVVLDSEAEAFLADVKFTAHYADSLAITTTTAFKVSHEDAYDYDVDETPHATAAFMANLTVTQAMHQEEQLDSDASPVLSDQISMISILDDMRVHENEDTLVHAEVSRTKMLEKMKDPECPIISLPINYPKLNILYDTFVPQKELTGEHAYWLPANEVASNQSKPAQQFIRTRPTKSQVNSHLKTLKSCFPEFDEAIKFKTIPTCLTDGEWHFEHTKSCFVEQIIHFYEKLKTHVKGIEDNLFKEVSEYMKIFNDLDKEYDQCVIDKKCVEIKNKNLLIQNECLLAESISKDICYVVLTPDNVVPISVEPCSNCDKEQTRNLELKAEISKVKQLFVDKERRCSHIKIEYLNLELKFQNYKECFENPQLKEELTVVRIKNDSLRDENVLIKARFQELYKSKAGSNSSVSSGATIPVKPKAVASGLYAITPKNKSVPDASKSKSKSDKKIHKNLPARSKKFVYVCKTCNECLVFGNHDDYVVKSVNAKKPKVIINANVKQVWKATGKVFASVGSRWKPTGRKLTLGDTCPLTRITKPEVVSLENSGSVRTSEPTNNVTVTPRFFEKPLANYKHKDRNTKDTSTGSPSNIETMTAKYHVIVYPLPI